MGLPRVIAKLGSDYFKEKCLPDICSGGQIISIALSESKAGTDAGNMQTSVERDGSDIILNGSKMWVTKAKQAGAFLVYARFPDGDIGAVVVDKGTDGLTLDDGTVNMAGHVQNEIYFDDYVVPEDQILVHYTGQGEYLRLQSQDESDNSGSIYATIATLRFGNPLRNVTGNPTYR
jgi:alkylation response protein AidB-like acyl-CoA dehydrogenase